MTQPKDTQAQKMELLPCVFSVLSWLLLIDIPAGGGTGSKKLVSQLPWYLLGGGDDGNIGDVINWDDIMVAIAAAASAPSMTVNERRTATCG